MAKFREGDIVCPKFEAENGAVVRKELTKIYYQTDDSCRYKEEDLLTEVEAFKAVIEYHKKRIEMYQEILDEKIKKEEKKGGNCIG
ncbi:MAG TPA: hypothetical protein PKW84_07205 [Fervidobacterium sp.]|nr:hypothetical protein [Fervidobacterium sp.]